MLLRNRLIRLATALLFAAAAGGLAAAKTTTPIKHVVVIFQENVSFDHYFATYPHATGTDGSPFTPGPGTPNVNGLSGALLKNNPNFNGSFGSPFRLTHEQAATCDQGHGYTQEQQAFDFGLMDMFPQFTNGACSPVSLEVGHPNDLVMGYYDGNTVTALWNYAQHFAMNDNSYSTGFGPSSPGAINLVSGNTANAIQDTPPSEGVDVTPDGVLFDDAQPTGDTCTSRDSAHLTGKNIGNLLNSAGITWGWFQGGFDLTIMNPNGTTGCKRSHSSVTGAFSTPKVDYIPHHQPFQYYSTTANPNHTRPSSVAAIGTSDDGGANHQYDSHDFFDALATGNFPAVVFLKAPGYQDGHAGYSSPLDEQIFIVRTINEIEASKFWDSTAVFILYDDSDGWYDHQMSPIVRHSQESTIDALTGPGLCGSSSNGIQAQGRCGYGPRQPFLVISGWAKNNFVDHTLTDQASITRFIEDNWNLGRLSSDNSYADSFAGTVQHMFDFSKTPGHVSNHKLFLDPQTGEVVK